MLAKRKELINHIYWQNIAIFPEGTQVSFDHHYHIDWQNKLMDPGRTIIKWESTYFFQAVKQAPQLPILKVGHKYCLVSYLQSIPAKKYIVRLIFKDLQGTVLDRQDFNDDKHSFVVPEDTVSYELSIINAGCYTLHFDRFDICPDELKSQVAPDIWVHQPINTNHEANNIVLLQGSKYADATYPELVNMTSLSLQLINVCWQSQVNVTRWLKEWIDNHQMSKGHLIIASPQFNMNALELTRRFPQLQLLLTTSIAGRSDESWDDHPVSWGTPSVVEIDWARLITKMNQLWN